MIVVTVVDDGVIIDEIQIEDKGQCSHAPYFNEYEWRSTRSVGMSGEIVHHPADGAMRLAYDVLRKRARR